MQQSGAHRPTRRDLPLLNSPASRDRHHQRTQTFSNTATFSLQPPRSSSNNDPTSRQVRTADTTARTALGTQKFRRKCLTSHGGSDRARSGGGGRVKGEPRVNQHAPPRMWSNRQRPPTRQSAPWKQKLLLRHFDSEARPGEDAGRSWHRHPAPPVP